MKKVYIVYGLVLFSLYAKAQGGKFQVGIGYQRTWMVDKQASPLKYQSSEKTFLIGYEHENAKARFDIKVNGALGDFFPTGFAGRLWYNPGYNNDGTPKNDSSTITGKLYSARIKIGYYRAVSPGYSKLGNNAIHTQQYVGGSLNNQIYYSDNILRMGWLNSTSVNADYAHKILINTKHQVDLKISIPLFARNSRLPYHNTISAGNGDSNVKTFFKQGSRFASIIDFQNIQIDASYEYAISKRLGVGIHYFGQWLRYSHEKPVTLFQNNIGVVASVK